MRRFNLNLLASTLLVVASLGVSFAQPTFNIQNKKDACNGLQNGSFDILVTASTGAVSAFIFNTGHSPNPIGPVSLTLGVPTSVTGLVGTAGGNITFVVVSDGNGTALPKSTTIFLLSNVSVTPPAPLVTDVTSCAPFNGAIDITPSGGSGTYTYLWTGPGGFVNPGTQDLSGIGPGNYTVTVSDQNTACSAVLGPITVNIVSPSITLGAIPGVCSGTASSTLTYTGTTGGVNQYSIDWASGPPDVALTPLPSSPIPITGIPTVVTTTTFNGTFTGQNSGTGCYSRHCN